MAHKAKPIKIRIGALLYDAPLYLWYRLLGWMTDKPYWLLTHNRNENISISKIGGKLAVRCDWEWTSRLHLPTVYPHFGHSLYSNAFDSFPIELATHRAKSDQPEITFIIGHRGKERLPNLLKTIDSIAGQNCESLACIVVEQDTEPKIRNHIPDWVDYVFDSLPLATDSYSRSRAFNIGAASAKSELLVFHDNDMLVPKIYADAMVRSYNLGYEIINLKRFIFYFDKLSAKKQFHQTKTIEDPNFEEIIQNLTAGGSIGVRQDTFLSLGGFDERFVGWGGEDTEFWQRAMTKTTWEYGFLPLVHLFHEAQPEKTHDKRNSNSELLEELMTEPLEQRIVYLQERWQQTYGPSI